MEGGRRGGGEKAHDECALVVKSLADICTGIEAPGLRISLLLTHGLPGCLWRAQPASQSLQDFLLAAAFPGLSFQPRCAQDSTARAGDRS